MIQAEAGMINNKTQNAVKGDILIVDDSSDNRNILETFYFLSTRKYDLQNSLAKAPKLLDMLRAN